MSALSEERRRIERAMLGCFLALRGVNLAQAAVCVSRGARGYRRPVVAKALAAAAAVESLWLFARSYPSGTYEHTVLLWADTAFGSAALVTMAGITSPEGRTTSLNWALPYTVVTTGSSRLGGSRRSARAATALLSAVYAASVKSSLRAGGENATTAVANLMSYGGFYLAVGSAINLLRSYAQQLETAHTEAIDRGQRLAAEAERNRQHRLLHDSALQTLEAVAADTDSTTPVLRRRAAAEAVRLRRALSGGPDTANDLVSGLDALVVEAVELGVSVELTVAHGVAAEGAVAAALHDAAREAITNVAKHSGERSAVIRAAAVPGGVEVTIRDHGRGFDPDAVDGGFGITRSIVERVAEAGGRASVWSAPGRGTRVTLWVPV